MRAVWLALLAGCALTSKAEPVELRYFSPAEHAPPHALLATSTSTSTSTVATPLQLGRVTTAANLRSRIAHRESAVEIDSYETLRWTETPDAYVRRSLARTLFDTGAFEQAVAGSGPVIDVEVLAFEQVHHDGRWSGRVQLRFELHDEHAVLARGVVLREVPASGDRIEDAVVAIGDAMDAAAAEVASQLRAPLQRGG